MNTVGHRRYERSNFRRRAEAGRLADAGQHTAGAEMVPRELLRTNGKRRLSPSRAGPGFQVGTGAGLCSGPDSKLFLTCP